MDELLLLAGQEDSGISDEQEWSRELIALRRWLAEDWLRPDPVVTQQQPAAVQSEGGATSDEREGAEDQEDMVMVQRPPWQSGGR